jgi:hypothetical protein
VGGVTPFKASTDISNSGKKAAIVSRIASAVHCRDNRKIAPAATMTRLRDR